MGDLSTPDSVQETGRRRCTRKRRQNPANASTLSTTRSAARTFWRTPMPSAAPTRARRAWTVRTSRPSRRTGRAMAGRTGAASGRDHRDRTQSDACIPKANGKPSRWASQPGIGLHDSSDAGAGADLRSRPSIGTYAYRPAKRSTGGGRGGRVAVPRPSGAGRRPRSLREHSPCRAFEDGSKVAGSSIGACCI